MGAICSCCLGPPKQEDDERSPLIDGRQSPRPSTTTGSCSSLGISTPTSSCSCGQLQCTSCGEIVVDPPDSPPEDPSVWWNSTLVATDSITTDEKRSSRASHKRVSFSPSTRQSPSEGNDKEPTAEAVNDSSFSFPQAVNEVTSYYG